MLRKLDAANSSQLISRLPLLAETKWPSNPMLKMLLLTSRKQKGIVTIGPPKTINGAAFNHVRAVFVVL